MCCLITDAVGDKIYIVILSPFFYLSPEALDYPDWLKRFYLEASTRVVETRIKIN